MRMRLIAAAILIASFGQIAGARAQSGASLYAANCAACHQAKGTGMPGAYPPLRGRIDKIAATPDGQHYLADVLLYGMVGQIEAGGASYAGYMPAFKRLSDADIAAVLSWLSSLGGSTPPPVIGAAEIAAARAQPLSPAAVATVRQTLDAAHKLP